MPLFGAKAPNDAPWPKAADFSFAFLAALGSLDVRVRSETDESRNDQTTPAAEAWAAGQRHLVAAVAGQRRPAAAVAGQ